MGKLKLLILALLLILPGAVGLWYGNSHQFAQQQQIEQWRPLVQDGTNQYLDSYQQWNALKPDQKLDNPWGKGLYGGPDIQHRLEQDQDKRLAVDIADLADGSRTIPDELAEVLYGTDWQLKVDAYKRTLEIREIVTIASFICLITGGLLFILFTIGAIIGMLFRKQPSESIEPLASPATQTPSKTDAKCKPLKSSPLEHPVEAIVKSSELPENSQPEPEKKNAGYFESIRSARKTAGLSTHAPIATADYRVTPVESVPPMMSPEPVLNSLSELTEEVSAIRQFAVQQNDQMKKLQDGYDWMIIRRFCMRIIRSIDNICDRIRLAQQQKQDTQALEEIRDELVYAMESGGVEPFEPDIGADYKGLERYAEAVRDKEPCNQPELSGKIARVLRPGYQYLINDDDVKIVRCAQVKLYE